MTHSVRFAALRGFTQRVAVLAILGMVCTNAWFAHGDDRRPAAKPAGPKAKKASHPPITAMRQRMLAQYHGKAVSTFTAIPGFGMRRMPLLYKVVPFQVPDLSTNEVEIEKEIVPPTVLKDVFAKSLDGFRDPAKPLPVHKGTAFGRRNGFGHPLSVSGGLQLRMLDLVGLIDADGPKVYSGGKAFEVRQMSAEETKAALRGNSAVKPLAPFAGLQQKLPDVAYAKALADAGKLQTRPLDVFETTGVAELRDGKDLFIRTRGNVIRMLGALRASAQCLECHSESKRGDLLGAFSYTFVDSANALAGELQGKSAK